MLQWCYGVIWRYGSCRAQISVPQESLLDLRAAFRIQTETRGLSFVWFEGSVSELAELRDAKLWHVTVVILLNL